MTNCEIVQIVAKEYNLSNLIKRMIEKSIWTHTYNDLEQYIYEVILQMDNLRLNDLYEANELQRFITQIIKNQRNNGKYFNTLLYNHQDIEFYDTIETDDHNYKLDFIIDKIESINFFVTGLTQIELRKDMAVTVLILYILKKTPKWKLCIDYQCGLSTLNLLIKDGKKYLREYWIKEGEQYIEKIKFENGTIINDDTQ
jgi:hypothetical protein